MMTSTSKTPRLYALCIQLNSSDAARKRYYRVSATAYSKPLAVRFFQSALLFGSLRLGLPMALRPVRQMNSETAPGVHALELMADHGT